MAHQIATDIYYPESDGQPMGETNLHWKLLVEMVLALTNYFEGRADVYATGNLFFYYVEGDPTASVCPDVCVVFGAAPRDRDIYKTWEDGPFPQVVIELTSPTTRRQDLHTKPGLYERLGVLEYYIFDPRPPRKGGIEAERGELQCYRRRGAQEPFGPVERVAPGAVVHSKMLGLGLVVARQELRLMDEATSVLLPTSHEEVVARRAAEVARQAAEAAWQAAEERARAEAQARQAEAQARQAAEERAQAEAQARQTAEEQVRAQAEELARLRAEREKRSEN